MSFSRKILAGLIAGVAVGLFFGERVAFLNVAAEGFVKLLQMTVLPYITVSIIGSLGSLEYTRARQLGVRVGSVIAALWAVALAFAFLIPLTFPSVQNASFFSTTLVERRPAFNFVDLYIPSNPFYSLANNIVPAVVLFSVLVGISLMTVDRKEVVLDPLRVAAAAIARATRLVTSLTPYGLFAIAAAAAGTMDIEQLGRLQIYLVSYTLVALFVSLWVLPGLVAALTPVPLRDLLGTTRDALITAFVAGDLFIVLPSLIEASKTLMIRHGVPSREAALPDVVVPASFNLPHSGKLLSLSFVLFAAWFSDASLSIHQYPELALSGLVSFFGSLNSAVPFLLDLFRIPADTFQLFLATGVVNARFGTLLAAVHTLCVAVLGTCAMEGLLTWDRRKIRRFLILTAVATAVLTATARGLFATWLAPVYTKDQILSQMPLLHPAKPATSVPSATADSGGNASTVLASIRARGVLRVGYFADSLPFAFVNARQEVVGYDAELAYRLAEELGVRAEFVQVPRETMAETVNEGRCDVIMSGIVLTTERASQMLFSDSYLDETLALLMPDYARERFVSWDEVRKLGPITLGAPDIPYFLEKLQERLPNATLKPFRSLDSVFDEAAQPDAVAVGAERGSAYTLLHPEYSVVVPQGDVVRIPLAYPVARHDEQFRAFLNLWIDLKRKDGSLDELFKYWILGQNAVPKPPRWSILDNVLGWRR